MKKFIIIAMATAWAGSAKAGDNEKLVSSSIKQVTVFLNGAQVNRLANASIPQEIPTWYLPNCLPILTVTAYRLSCRKRQ